MLHINILITTVHIEPPLSKISRRLSHRLNPTIEARLSIREGALGLGGPSKILSARAVDGMLAVV
jgi:hypothetical protein